MGSFKDEELLFLSNLMHMKAEKIIVDGVEVKSPFRDIWTDEYANQNFNIGELIKDINTDALRDKEGPYADYKFNGEISGTEWADMIDAMKTSDICKLRIQDVNRDDKAALISYLKDEEGNAYVVFRGTAAGEWPDNFSGAYLADTKQQKAALAYINSIDADNITVVGHSKGGNKAKYVAILSDKVTYCVSFDGQGFSPDFMEKYQDLVEKNKYKINCYALDEDFVNILMNDIYQEKSFKEGFGVSSFDQNHSPNSFFKFIINFKIEENKIKRIITGYDWKDSKQTEAMASLHFFVIYVYNALPETDREAFFNFLGKICDMTLGYKPPSYQKKYTKEELLTYLTADENARQIGLLMASLIKYEEYDNGISSAVIKILDSMGMSNITKWLRVVEKYVGTENILKYVLSKYETVVDLLKLFGAPEDVITLFSHMGQAYYQVKDSVKDVTYKNIAEYNPVENDYIRDFTQAKRDMLLQLTAEVTNESPYDVSKWDIWYRFEDWFGLLDIGSYQNNINEYYRKVIDINGLRNHQLIKIFSDVDQVSDDYKNKMEVEIQKLNQLSRNLERLFD
jgi:hypothetical protein